MANMIMFCILAVVILGSAIMCVTTTRIMDYTYLGAAQISVYAGGVTMIYVFAIQLVSKRTLQGLTERMKGSRVLWGGLLSIIGCATVILVLLKNQFMYVGNVVPDVEVPMKNIGQALVGSGRYEYVLAFEFISLFLLACIIGGLVVSRKEEEK